MSEVELKLLSNSHYDYVLSDLLGDGLNSVLSSLDFYYEMSKVYFIMKCRKFINLYKMLALAIYKSKVKL